jgi:hypothetical protein
LLSDGSGWVVLNLVPVNVIGGVDGTAQITDATQPGDIVYLKVVDADLNSDNGVAETVQVVVTNNGESETVTLTEVDVDDEIFFGSLASASGGAGTNNDGTINGVKGDVLTLTYDDVVTRRETWCRWTWCRRGRAICARVHCAPFLAWRIAPWWTRSRSAGPAARCS